jgi:hypothetical protein
MSNAGQQTRGLSAGDWTRLKRLSGARSSGNNAEGDLLTNRDINPVGPRQAIYSASMLSPYSGAGKPKTLRPASKWTDFIAAGRADFVTQSRNLNNSTMLNVTKICTCTTTALTTRVGLCRSCVVPR